MAIARLGSILGGISGTLNSVNFANTSQGLVLKKALHRVDHATAPQLSQRAYFQTIQHKWLEISDLQRTAWRARAKAFPLPNRLGKPSYLSGWQWFLKHSSFFFPLYGYVMADPPHFILTPPFLDFTITAQDDGFVSAHSWVWSSATKGAAVVYGSQPWSTKPRTTFTYWRFLNDWSSAVGAVVCTAQWRAAFGNLIEGQRIALKVIHFDPSLLPSFPILKTHTVTAAP